MKKHFKTLAALILVAIALLFAAPMTIKAAPPVPAVLTIGAAAGLQDAPAAVTPAIDDLKVDAIVALMGGSIAMAGIQWVKKKLKWTGFLAVVLTVAIDAVFTAGYFGYQLIFNHQAWNWLMIGIYIAAVFLWQKYGFRLSKWLGKTQAEISASTPSS